MKLGKVIALGLFGLILVAAKTAAAQGAPPNVNGITIPSFCDQLEEKFKESKLGKCQANLVECEQNTETLFQDLLIKNGCTNRQIVDCPPGSPEQLSGLDCFEFIVDPVCQEKSLLEAITTIGEQIKQECVDNPPEIPTTPPVGPKEPKPTDPNDPKDPTKPEAPVAQPEQPTDPFQVDDGGQGQAAPAPIFTLSGSGCSLSASGQGMSGFLNGFYLLLPLLGLRRKK